MCVLSTLSRDMHLWLFCSTSSRPLGIKIINGIVNKHTTVPFVVT